MDEETNKLLDCYYELKRKCTREDTNVRIENGEICRNEVKDEIKRAIEKLKAGEDDSTDDESEEECANQSSLVIKYPGCKRNKSKEEIVPPTPTKKSKSQEFKEVT